jgi:hypothetical protein
VVLLRGALFILTGILYALGALELSEESFNADSAVVFATFLAIIGSLVLLGVGTRRAHALAPGAGMCCPWPWVCRYCL